MRSRFPILISVLAVFALAIFFWPFFSRSVGAAAAGISGTVRTPISAVLGILRAGSYREQLAERELEVASLKAQLAALSFVPEPIDSGDGRMERVKVFSYYPFNERSTLTVNAGMSHGIAAGMAVLSAEKVFFGQVTHAGEQVSEVRTASDPQWELSVRVGPNEVDALFVGGRTPRLTLIANAGDVLPGDPIYLAAPGMPYGLLVGYVANVEEDTHHSFKEASVTLPHAHVQVVEVLILTR